MTRREAVAILERAAEAERSNVYRLRQEIDGLQDAVQRSLTAFRALDNDWSRVSLDRLAELVEEYGGTSGRWANVTEDEVPADGAA